ncbi:DUF4249 domain-containing protein [Mucilaginibacter sp. HD30]
MMKHIVNSIKTGKYLLVAALFGFITLYGCKQQFTPVLDDVNPNYIVVEGLINTGTDSTIFTISRTFKLEKNAVVTPEKGAVLQVESEAGITYVLPELVKSGTYGRPALNLDQTKKYRLRIRTKDNKEYLSDFVESRTAPPIDNVTFDYKNEAVNIYVNAHDPSAKSRYYRYNYIETWQYRADLLSDFKVENHQIKQRVYPEDDLFNCYQTANSKDIVLASTTKLTEDRVADKPVYSLAKGNTKLYLGYSLLIRQTVLTKEGFEFWDALKKNTESVGSIFDAQPSQLFGNIRSTTNPTAVVIGFISAGTVAEKRIFISTQDIPTDFYIRRNIDSTCIKATRSILLGAPVKEFLTGPDRPVFTPIEEIYAPMVGLIGYKATDVLPCVDCRTQGGTNKRPSYWR